VGIFAAPWFHYVLYIPYQNSFRYGLVHEFSLEHLYGKRVHKCGWIFGVSPGPTISDNDRGMLLDARRFSVERVLGGQDVMYS